MGVRNPFQKEDILLRLSFRDLAVLQKVLSSTLPEGNNEGAIMYLHGEVTKKIEEILNSET